MQPMYDVPIEHDLPTGAGMVHLKPIHCPHEQPKEAVMQRPPLDDADVVEIVYWSVPKGAAVYTYTNSDEGEQNEDNDDNQASLREKHSAHSGKRLVDNLLNDNQLFLLMIQLEQRFRNTTTADERSFLINEVIRIPSVFDAFLRLAGEQALHHRFPTTAHYSQIFVYENRQIGYIQQHMPTWQRQNDQPQQEPTRVKAVQNGNRGGQAAQAVQQQLQQGQQ